MYRPLLSTSQGCSTPRGAPFPPRPSNTTPYRHSLSYSSPSPRPPLPSSTHLHHAPLHCHPNLPLISHMQCPQLTLCSQDSTKGYRSHSSSRGVLPGILSALGDRHLHATSSLRCLPTFPPLLLHLCIITNSPGPGAFSLDSWLCLTSAVFAMLRQSTQSPPSAAPFHPSWHTCRGGASSWLLQFFR